MQHECLQKYARIVRGLTHGSSGLAPFGCAEPSFHSGPGAAKWSEPLNLNVRQAAQKKIHRAAPQLNASATEHGHLPWLGATNLTSFVRNIMNTSGPPRVSSIDHVHVHVSDIVAAEAWYAQVLGFRRTEELVFWASGGGPLTIQNIEGTVHIALFQRLPTKTHSTIALKVTAREYMNWRDHLAQILGESLESEDHDVSLSLYFKDPDGNPYELTTYEHEAVRRAIAASAA